jgi:hypothetical protein
MSMVLLLLTQAAAAPAERLDRLFAAAPLDQAGLITLAASDPDIAWQRLDPASRAAVDYILALPAAEIRRVREGQAVIRDFGAGSEDEARAAERLAVATGARTSRVRQVHVHTVDATLIRVDLVLPRETRGVPVAWPAYALPGRVALALADELGVLAPAASLQDGSFEVPWSAGLAWAESAPSGTLVLRDTARVKSGGTSLRLESRTRAKPSVSQVIPVFPGERLLVTAQGYAEGASPVLELRFDGPTGADAEAADPPPDGAGWAPLVLQTTVPPDATRAEVVLTLSGAGAAGFDDLNIRVEGPQPAPLSDWSATSVGSLVVHADPARCGAPCAEGGARARSALDAGLGLVSVPSQGTADLWLFADAAHRAALTPRAPGGPRGYADDPGSGACYALAPSPWAATCPIATMLTRAWGPPGNPVLGTGLPRALAGSGQELDGPARAALADTPSLTTLAARPIAGPSREAVVTAFAAWLLRTQSLAAVRAAWQTTDLGSYSIAGQDMAALEKAWRASLMDG